MDKVQKYNSFNTNTPSSESYRNYLILVSNIVFVFFSLPRSSAKVMNAWSYTSTHPIRFHGVMLLSIHAFAQKINIINTDQKLMCFIQFQFHLNVWNFLMAESKFELFHIFHIHYIIRYHVTHAIDKVYLKINGKLTYVTLDGIGIFVSERGTFHFH
jgi:hypothetical protein